MKQQNNVSLFKRDITNLGNVRVLTASALLAAASFVLAYIAKSIFGTGFIRVTFENLPIFFGSFLFGPASGALIAVSADLLSCFQAGMTPNLIVTLGAALIGGLSGILYRYVLPARYPRLRVVLAVAISHAVGSMIVKSCGLFVYYGWAVLYRIPVYLGITVVEALILSYLIGNKPLMRQIEKVLKS